jgi:SAM-dependent methyltransferase
MVTENTFRWAIHGLTKDLILNEGPPFVAGRRVSRILDVGSAASEEIVDLCPEATEYLFLDSFVLPPSRPRYRLMQQGVGERFPIDDATLDVVCTNGSFDHFTQPDRMRAFREIERCLRPGGILLFACEYFDFPPEEERAFFERFSAADQMRAINCGASSNIDLRAIVEGLDTLRIRQHDLSMVPDGRPLRAFASLEDATYFRPNEPGVDAVYGSFFVVFDKAGPVARCASGSRASSTSRCST